LGDSQGKRERRIMDKYRERREQGDGHSQLNTTLVDGDEV
jgi:hypothetical protein